VKWVSVRGAGGGLGRRSQRDVDGGGLSNEDGIQRCPGRLDHGALPT